MLADEASSNVPPTPASTSASTHVSHADLNPGDGVSGVSAIDTHSPSTPQAISNSESAQLSTDVQPEESSDKHVSNLVEYLDNSKEDDGQLTNLLNKVNSEMLRSSRERLNLVPLLSAAERGMHNAIKRLMQLDAPAAMSEDWLDRTPLALACTRGHLEVVKELVKSGANVNEENSTGASPLMIASRDGWIDIVTYLLDAQANALATDEDGWTALHFACCNGEKLVAQVLLDKESKLLNIEDRLRRLTALGLAMDYGEWEMARWLLERDREQQDSTIRVDVKLVAMTVHSGQNDTLKLLLDKRHNLQDQLKPWDENNGMPLLNYALQRSLEMFNILVEAQAKPDTANPQEETALMKACLRRQPGEVKNLLSLISKVDINASDRFNETALHKAARLGYLDIVEMLLSHQADPEKQNSEGMTALHIACAAGTSRVDVGDRDDSDAESQQHSRRLSLGSEPSVTKSRGQRDEVIRALLKAKANPFTKDNKKRSAFHHAVSNDREPSTLPSLLTGLEKHYLDDHHHRNMHDESELLLWAANKKERHVIIRTLLSHVPEVAKRGVGTVSLLPENAEWTAVEWAVFYGFPLLLLKVLDALREAEVPWKLDKALSIAGAFSQEELRAKGALKKTPNVAESNSTYEEKPETEIASESNPRAKDGKTGYDEKPKQKSSFTLDLNRELVLHLLQNSNLTALSRKEKKLVKPTSRLGDENDEILDEWKATMIYFRHSKNGFEAFRCERSVNSVIYKDGPRKAMLDANNVLRGSLQGILDKVKETDPDVKRQVQYHIPQIPTDSIDGAFRWVHLPAKNMVWMNDLLTRIMYDHTIMPEKSTTSPGQNSESQQGGMASVFLELKMLPELKTRQKQYQDIESFLNSTWSQIPDRTSRFRIMKPRFVESEHAIGGNRIRAIYLPYLVYSDYPAKPEEEAKTNGKKIKVPERGEKLPATGDPHNSSTKPKEVGEEYQARNDDSRTRKMHQRWRSLREKADMHIKLRRKYQNDVFHRCSTLDEFYYHFKIENSAAEKDRSHRNKTQIVAESDRRERREEAEGRKGGKGGEKRDQQDKTRYKTHPDQVTQHSWTGRMKAWSRSNTRTEKSQQGKNPTPSSERELYWPILRVNQLWVWVIGEEWLITASADPHDDAAPKLITSFLEHLKKETTVWGLSAQPKNTFDMSKMLMEYCIGAYHRVPPGTDRRGRPQRSVRQIFSQFVTEIAREETELYESCRKQNESEGIEAQRNSGNNGKMTMENMRKVTLLSNQVKDVRDELNILSTIARFQMTVQQKQSDLEQGSPRDQATALPPATTDQTDETVAQLRADYSAAYIDRHLSDMKQTAQRLQDALDTTLSLLQNTISIEQNYIAIDQSNETVKQGRTMMVFTLINIVFLPLSFLSTYFALDFSDFFNTPAWVHQVIFLVSMGFSAIFSVIAWLWVRSYDKDKGPLFSKKKAGGGGPASETATHNKGLHHVLGAQHKQPTNVSSEKAKRRAGENGTTSGLSRSFRPPTLRRWRRRERADQDGGSYA